MATVHPIRRFREERELTQVETARFLGVSAITISRWETYAHKVDPRLAHKISRLTGIHPAKLCPDLQPLFNSREDP